MGKDDEPSIEEQKEFVQTHLNRPLIPGETWYLIDAKWMKFLGGFLGLGGSSTRFLAADPGTIDNSRLLSKDGSLNLGLEEGVDYELVHEQLWRQLAEWYGTYPDQQPIARQTVEISPNYVVVEVYPVRIQASPNFSMSPQVLLTFSRTTPIKTVESEIRRKFNVKADTRLWLITPGATPEVLDSNKTLSDYGVVGENNHFVLEMEGEFHDWSDRDGVSGDKKFASDNDLSTDSNKMSTETPHIPGVCGLSNLRNTCFMNAVLQCMSNCPPITQYFLAKRHLSELNRYNPLGMRGEMALAFGTLISTMWSGNHLFTSPIHFKVQVGRFNPVFSGCQQHDSQELLTFLLDGLHEDLNRIKQKPYTQVNDDSDREDKILASEAWERHRKRNDSIIVDTFHGLLKSRVVCPDCKKVSVTFDPFCNLSLPLPQKKDRVITITWVPLNSQWPISKLKLDIPRQGIVSDLYNHKTIKLSEHTTASVTSHLAVEMSKSHIHRCYSDDDNLDNIHDQDNIFVFELPTAADKTTGDRPMIIPVYFWEVNENSEKFDNNQLFGVPFFFALPNHKISETELRIKLLEPIQQRFNVRLLPKENNSQDQDQVDRAMKDSWFSIHYKDGASREMPTLIDFQNSSVDLKELLGLEDDSYSFFSGRKILVLGFTKELRRDVYVEKKINIPVNSWKNPEERIIDIYDCLTLFTTCEKLGADDAWYCPQCKKHQRATKKIDLWDLPKILIIHLKRFSYTRLLRDKIDSKVECPLMHLKMSQYLTKRDRPQSDYNLIGVVNHYGGMGGGHYTANCKNAKLQSWFNFDDNLVTPIASDRAVSSAAYVLFYMASDA